ncbi:MAG TPA: nucleotide exchange factor GrpE [Jatrophihabitans sp.]|nr:nucleotide exchange factor GrpE [Jatrophihabitans sp.]
MSAERDASFGSAAGLGNEPGESERVVIRDNRKIDPVTGEVRKPSSGGASAPPSGRAGADPAAPGAISSEEDVPKAQALLVEERTRDLQRLQAEYANYRKRAERERLAAGDLATGRALAELLPVLDDLDRAKAHGDLTGGLKAVADKLDATFSKLGLVAFGEVGDPFDPAVHEAVMHAESDTVTVPTCTTVLRQGYKHRDRLLRPAMVGVTDPLHFAPAAAESPTEGEVDTSDAHSEPTAQPHENEVPTERDPAEGQ